MANRSAGIPIICLFLVVLVIAGCNTQEVGEIEEQVLTFNLSSEPESIDPGRASGQPDLTLVNAVMEGLTRYNLQSEIEPAMAEDWEISEDGRVYTFFIRDDVQWSNGDPVTAYDFEYAWKRVLDPEYASSYAYQLYSIKNAAAYNDPENTEVNSSDMVGVEVLSDTVLEVVLEAPASHFLSLTAFPTFFPVHKGTAEADPDWFTSPETYVNNGPFKISGWEEHQRFICEKNDSYWDKDNVNLQRLVFTLVSEESTALAMYETDDLDMVYNIPAQELDRLKADPNSGLVIGSDLAVAKYIFNITEPPLDDVKVRKALAKSIHRDELVEYVTKAGEKPAYAYVPYGLPDINPQDDFRKVGGDYFKEDIEKARELLKSAGFPEGEGFPELELLINDSQDNIRLAQAVQEMWKQNLGINIKVRPIEWRVYLGKMFDMEHDIAAAGWGADYNDPMTFLEFYASWSGNNTSGYSSDEYDEKINLAAASNDPEVRVSAMHKAESDLMEHMPMIPVYFYTQPYLVKEQVTDLLVTSFGPQAEFKWAYIEK